MSYSGHPFSHHTGKRFQAKQLIVHPNFRQRRNPYFTTHKYNSFAFDYCLAEIDKVDFDALKTNGKYADVTMLPEKHAPFAIGQPGEKEISTNCMIVGWGPTRLNGGQSPVKQEAPIEIMSKSYCQNAANGVSIHGSTLLSKYKKYYERVEGTYSFCAGKEGSKVDTCPGDSGGPLFCEINGEWRIIGITSHGPDCGYGHPGIYAKVAFVLPWIKDNTDCK